MPSSTPISTANPKQASPASTTWALASLSLCMLLSSLGTSIANVGLPTLAHAFDAPFQQVQWVVIAYLLSITSVVVSMGRLGDVWGRRRLLLWGATLFTLASVASGLAPTLGLLIAARAVQGLGAAAMMALTLALVSELIPKDKAGSAMGLLGTMSAIGTALGPSMGGLLIAGLGWRALFLVNLPLGAVALMLGLKNLPPDRLSGARLPTHFDTIGTLLLTISLASYALAVTVGRGHFNWVNLVLVSTAGVALALFIRVQHTAASPLLQLNLFQDTSLRASLIMGTLVATVMMATLVVGPFYMAQALGLAPAALGLCMAVGPIVSGLCGVPVGRLIDRTGPQRVVLLGLSLMVLGCATLVASPSDWGLLGYMVPLVLTTLGYVFFHTANNTAVMGAIGQSQRGVISGLLSLSRNLGLITGASVMGAVFAMGVGSSAISTASAHAVTTGMRASYSVAAILVASALAIALSTKRKPAD